MNKFSSIGSPQEKFSTVFLLALGVLCFGESTARGEYPPAPPASSRGASPSYAPAAPASTTRSGIGAPPEAPSASAVVESAPPASAGSSDAGSPSATVETLRVSKQDVRIGLVPTFEGGKPGTVRIEGTALEYAPNSTSPVLKTPDGTWFTCENGVWFTAAAPNGPWGVATAIPSDISRIPAEHPLAFVTAARLREYDGTYVWFDVAPGYYAPVSDAPPATAEQAAPAPVGTNTVLAPAPAATQPPVAGSSSGSVASTVVPAAPEAPSYSVSPVVEYNYTINYVDSSPTWRTDYWLGWGLGIGFTGRHWGLSLGWGFDPFWPNYYGYYRPVYHAHYYPGYRPIYRPQPIYRPSPFNRPPPDFRRPGVYHPVPYRPVPYRPAPRPAFVPVRPGNRVVIVNRPVRPIGIATPPPRAGVVYYNRQPVAPVRHPGPGPRQGPPPARRPGGPVAPVRTTPPVTSRPLPSAAPRTYSPPATRPAPPPPSGPRVAPQPQPVRPAPQPRPSPPVRSAPPPAARPAPASPPPPRAAPPPPPPSSSPRYSAPSQGSGGGRGGSDRDRPPPGGGGGRR